MPTSYPKDRFDTLPRHVDRVGAHRAPAKKGRGWIGFWWAAAATVVLIGLGVVWLSVLNNRLAFDLPGVPTGSASPSAAASATRSPAPSAVPTIKPTVDPSLTVTVLNGTMGIGVARGVGDRLTAAGWAVGTMSDASTSDVTKTVVYYADPKLEGAARGVAASVPGSTILLSQVFAGSAADLTVVIGSDYVPPAG